MPKKTKPVEPDDVLRDETVEKFASLGGASPDELEFVRLIAELGTIKAACDEMWPEISQRERKGHIWLKKPVVRAALAVEMTNRAVADPRQIRIMFEQCGFGLTDRVKIVAKLAKDPNTSKNVVAQLVDYADELEGRKKKAGNDAPLSGLLEAIVLAGAQDTKKRASEAKIARPAQEDKTCRPANAGAVKN